MLIDPTSYLLGIDTGGTYTDAVIYREVDSCVVAKAKSPTTHDDLALGIRAAMEAVFSAADVSASAITMVSLSTTLATNALVENKGRNACLITIGFEREALDRAGLRDTLGTGEVIMMGGGHGPHGEQLEELDLDALGLMVSELGELVEAFAITAQFAVRNPSHELAARELVRSLTNRPVTCSHELSARLNGPRRAVTTLLNARLSPLIDNLVSTTESIISELNIKAPLMVVRGDGSLVSAGFVRERPVETILSGPAASLVGAAHLSGLPNALIADMGGTTTDIAVLRHGVPELADQGAVVGGHETMVEAVRMRTHGLGGDSEIRLADRPDGAQLLIGPRRVTPLCQLAISAPDLVEETLRRQIASDVPSELQGMIVSASESAQAGSASDRAEARILGSIGSRTLAVDRVVQRGVDQRALGRLVDRGLVRLSGFTPTDACHVLGLQSHHGRHVATLAAELFARRRDRFGRPVAESAEKISEVVVATVDRLLVEAVLAAAMSRDGLPDGSVKSPVVAAALDRSVDTVRLSAGLAVPLVGLGAPATTYFPSVGEALATEVVVPEHADVANAIGAVVGSVRISRSVSITSPRRGLFVVHTRAEQITSWYLDDAKRVARESLEAEMTTAMRRAGAVEFDLEFDWAEKSVDVNGRSLFVDGMMKSTATGRPQLDH